MAHGFRVVDRDQRFLMPPSIDEWVPEDHPVRFVVDAVSLLDLSAFEAKYRLGGTGRRAFDPEMMVGLLLWAFSNGVYASRGIERRCESDVMFRFVTGNEVPDHATIARFRQTHEDALRGLHAQVLAMCAQVGLVRVGAVFLDGTKLGAAASKSQNKSMEWLDAEIAEWFRAAGEADDRDDDEFGDGRGDETPADLARREARRASLEAARDHLEAEQAAKGAKTRTGRDRRVNVTDPDSALLPTQGGGWVQGYNAQAVATADRVVLATSVCAETADSTQLLAMIEAVGVELDAAGIAEEVGTGGCQELRVRWSGEGVGDAVGVGDHERVECPFPALGVGAELAASVVADAVDGEVEDLQDGVVGGKRALGLGDLAQLVVQRLDGVGRVDDLADRGVEREERGEPVPVPTPQIDDGRVAAAPLGLELVEGVAGGFDGRC